MAEGVQFEFDSLNVDLSKQREIKYQSILKRTLRCGHDSNDRDDAFVTKEEHTLLLNNVSGRLRGGNFVALMGGSGAGKTTLLNVLSNRYEETSRRWQKGGWLGRIGPYLTNIVTRSGRLLVNSSQVSNDYFS